MGIRTGVSRKRKTSAKHRVKRVESEANLKGCSEEERASDGGSGVVRGRTDETRKTKHRDTKKTVSPHKKA